MSKKQDMQRLSALAGMLRDIELGQVATLATARQSSLDRLADLEKPRTTAELDAVQAELAQVRYQAWADQRRAELRLVLERQTRALCQAQDKARLALGRSDVLQRLVERR